MSLRSLRGTEGLKSVDAFRVSIDLIHEQEGFNARDYNSARVQERIRDYADAYKMAYDHAQENPKLKINPLDALGPWEVRVTTNEDGTKTIFLTDGHLRKQGAELARAEGAKLDIILVNEDKSLTFAHSIARTVTSQDGLKLQPLEVARVYKRLMDSEGLTVIEVADLMNKTVMHVQQNLSLLQLPDSILAMVDAGKVAANVARQLVSEHGAEGAERILVVSEELTEEGDKKITAKVIEQAKTQNPTARKPAQRLSKKLYDALRDHTISLTDRVWANVPKNIPDDQDEVTITMTFNRNDLAQMKEIREIAAQQKDEEKSDEEQLDLLTDKQEVALPKQWEEFAEEEGGNNDQFMLDVLDRFNRVVSNPDLLSLDAPVNEAKKAEMWACLEDRATKAELMNIKLMRSALRIMMS